MNDGENKVDKYTNCQVISLKSISYEKSMFDQKSELCI